MNKIKMLYKADTGNQANLFIEHEILKRKVFNNFDQKTKAIEIDKFPEEYRDGDDLKIPSPEYINWLEMKL